MNTEAAEAAFLHARRVSPSFVVERGEKNQEPDITVGFYGALGSASTNRSLSFQGSLFREMGLETKLVSLRDGCFECSYLLGGVGPSQQLSQQISKGKFDSLAYRYRVLFVRFLSQPQLDEVHFERDSLFR